MNPGLEGPIMLRRPWPALVLVWIGFLNGAEWAVAQGDVPVVTGIFPPGATIGQATEWVISGRNLTKVKTLRISGQGVELVDFSIQGENSAKARISVASHAEPGFREVRLDGPAGISNLAVVRIDRLTQVVEIEPNGSIAEAQPIEAGTAVAGVLKGLDQDHYRIKGTPGQKLTIDLEARRLGTSIGPVVTIFSADGHAIAQGRESRGLDQDCRMAMVLPEDGLCVIQVRDNTYGGGDQARYRLRVDPSPHATGVFPIGGPKGQTIDLEISGGNLAEPLRKSITLPDTPGALIEPGSVEGPGGLVVIPGRIMVGDSPEVVEPVEIKPGVVINGRISREGEVDSYRMAVKAGEKFRLKVEAAAMGSWLDSVIAIRDDKGATLVENDDSLEALRPEQASSVGALGLPQGSPDSSLEYQAKEDRTLTIEVIDRFGEGGPEYPYRLAITRDRPDFAVTLLLGNATANASALSNFGQAKTVRTSPGQFGVFNLKPGGSVPINFVIAPEGRPGPIEVSVEGLPEGVIADPVLIRFPGPKSTTSRADPIADFILLKVAPFTQPGLSDLRIVARARPSTGIVITHDASAVIGIDTSAVSGRPIIRVLNRIPLRILGEARPQIVGPPSPPKLLRVSVPGPLLQGDQVDLKLEFAGIVSDDDRSTLEATAEGVGLTTRIVIPTGTSLVDDDRGAIVVVHVQASIVAEPGTHPVKVAYTLPGRPTMTKEVSVEVKPPIEVRPSTETIFLKPGDQATFRVVIRREAGFDGEVEIKIDGLPVGVKTVGNLELGPGKSSLEIRLEMENGTKPIERPVGLRVVGMARMPRGNVSVESKIRPMIEARLADK
jgi:hypothetical protein